MIITIHTTNKMNSVKKIKPAYLNILIIFMIWLIASCLIAQQGLYISDYHVHVRGMTQADHIYPLGGVIFCIFAYALVCLNYMLLFNLKWSLQHPFIAYLSFSIIPILIAFYAFLMAMHAPPYWGAFITIMLLTILLHLLLLPVLFAKWRRKYHTPIQANAETSTTI